MFIKRRKTELNVGHILKAALFCSLSLSFFFSFSLSLSFSHSPYLSLSPSLSPTLSLSLSLSLTLPISLSRSLSLSQTHTQSVFLQSQSVCMFVTFSRSSFTISSSLFCLWYSSLHWFIVVLFYALFIKWSIFSQANIFKRLKGNCWL